MGRTYPVRVAETNVRICRWLRVRSCRCAVNLDALEDLRRRQLSEESSKVRAVIAGAQQPQPDAVLLH